MGFPALALISFNSRCDVTCIPAALLSTAFHITNSRDISSTTSVEMNRADAPLCCEELVFPDLALNEF